MIFDNSTRKVWDDLSVRVTNQRKTQRDKLAVLVTTMLQVRSANLMELGAGLPIKTTDALSRFQWIKRFLGNDLKPFSFLLDQLNGFKPFIGADVPCVG